MKKKTTAGWLIAALILFPFIAYGLSSFIPQYDGFIVTSGSMEPEIQTGSLLFTLKAPAENIEVGDTITFREGESHTTHKVIQKNSSNSQITFRTQGVANETPDPGVVTADELVGKKLFSIPLLGYLIVWAGTPVGLTLLVLIPGTILILLEPREGFWLRAKYVELRIKVVSNRLQNF